MNVEEREIKQLEEFEEITPESSQNLITDNGRFTLGSLYNAVLEYIRDLVSVITSQATEESTALAESYANSSQGFAEQSHEYLIQAKESASYAEALVINATELGRTKSNRGELYFGGSSYIQTPLITYTQGDSFSVALRIKAKHDGGVYINSSTQVNLFNLEFLHLYVSTSTGKTLALYSGNNVLPICAISETEHSKLFNDNEQWHSLIVVYDGTNLKLFNDGTNLKLFNGGNASESTMATLPTKTAKFKFGTNLVGQMADIKMFNFDMSADDAPYTIADYIAGKDEPPSSAIISLANYAFNGEVLDNSGNGNNATVSGVVKGTHDNAVENLFQKIASRIQNLT